MSDAISYATEGISQLVIETLARDAVLRGVPGATTIQIMSVASDRSGGGEFIPEGRAVRFTKATAERILVPEDLTIVIRDAPGDLRVQNLTGSISLEAIHGDLRLEAVAGQVMLAQADADVRAEGVSDLRILGRCQGDLRFADGGRLAVEAADGDLRVSNATEVQVGQLHGDLWVEKLSAGIQAQRLEGDARLNDVGGPAVVHFLSGDLRGQALAGGLLASQVNGDILLNGPYVSAEGYTLRADGDIQVHLPADADVRLSVHAAGRIRSDVLLTPSADGTPAFSAVIGQGACRLALTGRGDLRISQEGAQPGRSGWERSRKSDDPFAELSNLGERIRQQVTASLSAAGINIETGDYGWGRGGRGGRAGRPVPPSPPTERPKPPTPPASATAQEQLAILKMVEEGRITPEEADRLLKALGA